MGTSQAHVAGGDRRFQALFDHAPVGVALCSLDGRFVDVNAALRDLLAGSAVDPREGCLDDLARGRRRVEDDVDPRPRFAAALDAVRAGRGVAKADLPLPVAGRATRWLSLTTTRVSLDEEPYLLVHVEDVTLRRREESRLARLALRDGLTGLANRTLVTERLDDALERAARSGLSVGVLFLDLDDFKKINDTHGHEAGDTLLVAVAQRLTTVVRAGDTAGRLGGDEFVVVAENLTGEMALGELVRRVDAAVNGPIRLAGTEVAIGASVGAVLSRAGDTGAAVVRRADAAMFAVKRARRRGSRTPAPEADTLQLTLLHEQAVVARS